MNHMNKLNKLEWEAVLSGCKADLKKARSDGAKLFEAGASFRALLNVLASIAHLEGKIEVLERVVDDLEDEK